MRAICFGNDKFERQACKTAPGWPLTRKVFRADIDPSQYPSLVALMDEAFTKYADRIAYSFMGKDISYAETDSLSRAPRPTCRAWGWPKAIASPS